MIRLPHAVPYQGSKRSLAPAIAPYFPPDIVTLYEPFAGSAAMTIYAAHYGLARRFVIADNLTPMVDLLRAIVEEPSRIAREYAERWKGQKPGDNNYFNTVRERYNTSHDPIDLLYLICRCVKNAIRFNAKGRFTQSVDKRRLGMGPDRMAAAVEGVSRLLKGRTEFRVGDWLETTVDAREHDFLYMDPPYLGTSVGRDKRYHSQLQAATLEAGLASLLNRDLRFALSYDGMTGEKVYGPPLASHLGLTRLLLHAGMSAQATLAGRAAVTVESLYLSPGLAEPVEGVIRREKQSQPELAL